MKRLALAFALLLSVGTSVAHASDSLYERLGEKPGIARIASRMIDYAMSDDRIKEAFAHVDTHRLKGLITLYFCKQVGGPCKYPGRSMEQAHAGIGIHDRHFNAVVEDLQKSLTDENIPSATQNEFLALLAPTHSDIVKD